MTRRWTPQHVIIMRRLRILICVAAVALACVAAFLVGTRKSVALTINGETRTVTTYAMSVDRLLSEQNVDVKSHDSVSSTTGGSLSNHSVVTIRKAYQATITIDGKAVPFWTTASSTTQLLRFFQSNEKQSERVTVNISNVYNQLTGGIVIRQDGPVTVIADGKKTTVKNGKASAASILDTAGVTLGKNDRVSVALENGRTILRVQRITHRTESETVSTPYGTQTVVDDSLSPGEKVVRQKGVTGSTRRTYDVTYADGVEDSRKLTSTTVITSPLDEIIAVGPESSESTPSQSSGDGSGSGSSSSSAGGSSSGSTNDGDSDTASPSPSPSTSTSTSGGTSPTSPQPTTQPTTEPTTPTTPTSPTTPSTPDPSPSPSPNDDDDDDTPSTAQLWHPTPAQAQAYASGAAAAYGWTGQQWTDLVWIWNHESSWMWSAENASSGAYGIPQALPASKMAAFGADWRNDAAIQISWGLNYISERYGSPSKARAWWNKYHWY